MGQWLYILGLLGVVGISSVLDTGETMALEGVTLEKVSGLPPQARTLQKEGDAFHWEELAPTNFRYP